MIFERRVYKASGKTAAQIESELNGTYKNWAIVASADVGGNMFLLLERRID